MESPTTTVDSRSRELAQQANYWKAMHARAVQREVFWKERALHWEGVAHQEAAELQELTEQLAALQAKVAWLQKQVFGRKSEQAEIGPETQGQAEGTAPSSPGVRVGRKRGQQPGQKGHGRKTHPDLPTEERLYHLPANQQCCPCCGLPFRVFPGTEDSEEITWEVIVKRRVHRRTRYQPTCQCGAVPGIITAPGPSKLIPKGLFSVEFWVRLLLGKFLFQIPLYRLRQMLALEGLAVSQGTLTGGLSRLGVLLQPLYTRILERSRTADHWHMDETRWMVFVEVEGKSGYRWWLWVVVTKDTCAYILDPSRSAKVPRDHLGKDAKGIINADRYAVYKTLGEGIQVAFCWSHVRRDFVNVGNGYPRLHAWAETWEQRIDAIFHINRQRLDASAQPETFQVHDGALREALTRMVEERDRELQEPSLHPAQQKTLESLKNHWEGLTLFLDHPEIPMDNNEAERRIRTPVVGRKNYYGSGAIWSGTLAACLFTIFQTLLLNGLDPEQFLQAYFEACAEAGGHPPEDLEAFLPWNLSPEKRIAWSYPNHPP